MVEEPHRDTLRGRREGSRTVVRFSEERQPKETHLQRERLPGPGGRSRTLGMMQRRAAQPRW